MSRWNSYFNHDIFTVFWSWIKKKKKLKPAHANMMQFCWISCLLTVFSAMTFMYLTDNQTLGGYLGKYPKMLVKFQKTNTDHSYVLSTSEKY